MDDDTKLRKLAAACKRARLDPLEVLGKCHNGDMQMIDIAGGFAVTTIEISGTNKTCFIVLVGGTLPAVKKLAEVVEDHAKALGCNYIRTIGRNGFAKVYDKLAEGYRPVGVLYEKAL